MVWQIAAAMATGGAIGGLMQADNDRKTANRTNNKILEMLGSYSKTRQIGEKQLKRDINQARGSNMTVQASSGFSSDSFAPLNNLFETQAQENIDLYNTETQLGRQQILAGQVATPNKFQQGFNIAANTFGTFASFYKPTS
jgi:hypothetical protein